MWRPKFERLASFAAMLVLCACQPKEAVEKPPPSFRPPTATEVFDLRSKCVALGEKIMQDNLIGIALAQEQLSHYNLETNHCYVKLEVHTANLSTPQEQFLRETYLSDGQTRELLATSYSMGTKQWGNIFPDSLRKFAHDQAMPTYQETDALIDKFMAEDRKP